MFRLGQVVATPGALAFLEEQNVSSRSLLRRHISCDWGDLDSEDKKANDDALIDGDRIFSSYKIGVGKVWIITEASREVTTILLPSEY